jgi:ABC-type transport system involved in multi-copper enzyme maturation permease subunit
MKALILKELRENLKLGVIGLVMAVAVVAGTQIYYLNLIKDIASGVSVAQNYSYRLQPLTSGNFEAFSGLLCVLVGLMIGWFQIHNERHRDLWAFLVHRPVTRTTIFLSKAIAGLLLYALAVGLPLGYFVLWVRMPGQVAAPFEWGMGWLPLAAFLSGVAWYFAGMLTGLRQARWYGSRGLGLAAALLAMIAIYSGLPFWLGILATVTLAFAVWGGFHNQGRFEGQPVAGQAALTLSLIPGAALAFLGLVALALEIVIGLNGETIWPIYAMGRDGVIYKVTQGGPSPQVVGLDGQPLKDPDTSQPMESQKFNGGFGTGALIAARWGDWSPRGSQSERFEIVSGDRHTLWFYMHATGRIEGYDVQTRRFIGSIGPEGFAAANKHGDGSGFLHDSRWDNFAWNGSPGVVPAFSRLSGWLMASATGVYQVDLDNRSVKLLWTATTNGTIQACSSGFARNLTLVVTRSNLLLFDFNSEGAKEVWSTPFPYSTEDYSSAQVYSEGPRARGAAPYSVWISASPWPGFDSSSAVPTHVLWLTDNGEVTKSENLPPLKSRQSSHDGAQILNALLPPSVQVMWPWLTGRPSPQVIDWHAVGVSLGAGAACVVVGLLLGRRYSFSAKRQAIWGVFNLLFGVPGLLAFVSVEEWPARERCASCGKLRVVGNENCEHCSSGFPAPRKNGTEIFEALETA